MAYATILDYRFFVMAIILKSHYYNILYLIGALQPVRKEDVIY